MSRSMDLTIRRFERNDIVLDALLEVNESHRDQVVFSSSNPFAVNDHLLKVTLADIGDGGVGIHASAFIPRGLTGRVRVMAPRLVEAGGALDDHQSGSDGDMGQGILFEHEVRVRRVELTSRVPTFFIGTSFENPPADMRQRVEDFISRASEALRTINMARLQAMEHGDAA